MKLIRLKITDGKGFRSLPKDFEIYFLRDFDYDKATDFNPYILAGRNGSGKSNILEALAEIFFHLDCIYLSVKPDYFNKSKENPEGFDPKKAIINAYELEYFTFLDSNTFLDCKNLDDKAYIKISKKWNDRPEIKWVNQENFRKIKSLNPTEIKALLPEYVVGYASGHNETLSLPFFKSRFLQFDEYLTNLGTEEYVDPGFQSSLIFLDQSFSQSILLTNLLMNSNLNGNQDVLQPFRDYVNLEDIESFRLIINTGKGIEIPIQVLTGKNHRFTSTSVNLVRSIDNKSTNETVFISSYLEKLKRCATAWEEEVNFDTPPEDEDDPEFAFEDSRYLILDYKVNKATKEAFQFHFENDPLILFELFQLLIVMNNHEVSIKEKQRTYSSKNPFIVNDIHHLPKEKDRILRFKDFFITKSGISKPIFTKNLSDGEHQFLHTIGLSLLFKDKRTLFLLDEPETHFNPDWKAKYISSIRNSFSKEKEDSSKTMREMLITTHSPYLISDSQMDYVQIFEKNLKNNKVKEPKRPDFQTFGTSVNKIGIRIFDMPNTIGEYAQQKLNEFRNELNRLESPEKTEDLISRIQNEIGESVERALLINEIIDYQKSAGK